MKKLIALAVVFVLLLGLFAGCKTAPGKEPTESEPTETEAVTPPPKPVRPTPPIIGSWKHSMDMRPLVDALRENIRELGIEELSALWDVFGYLYEDTTVVTIMDLKEDHTYVMYYDKDSAEAAVAQMKANVDKYFPEIMQGFTGMTMEELEAALAERGMTTDDAREELIAQFDVDTVITQLQTGLSADEGSYTYEDGKLTMSSTAMPGIQTVYIVELNGDELKVTGIDGDGAENFPKSILPLIFIR